MTEEVVEGIYVASGKGKIVGDMCACMCVCVRESVYVWCCEVWSFQQSNMLHFKKLIMFNDWMITFPNGNKFCGYILEEKIILENYNNSLIL